MFSQKIDEAELNEPENIVNLSLGDIIKFIAPHNEELNNKIFYISYIDNLKINFINKEQNIVIKIDDDGKLHEKSIDIIEILSKAEFNGYAKQNNLNINTWVSIQFEGELPITINGIITDLDNDMIEIKTYPDEEYIYIDFEYKGIPEDLPIKSITIIENPTEKKISEEETEEETLLFDDTDLQNIPINKDMFEKELLEITIPNEFISFGDDEEIKLFIDVEKSEQRFNIEKQLNDLLDEMLSSIPNSDRTSVVMNDIHKQIERFNQLRNMFSKIDLNKNYNLPDQVSENFKPLINKIITMNNNIKWITTVATDKKVFYSFNNDIQEDDTSYDVKNIYNDLEQYYDETEVIKSDSNLESVNKYKLILLNISDFNKTFSNNSQQYISKVTVKNYINTLINNYDVINSNVVKTNKDFTNVKSYGFYNQVFTSPDTNLTQNIENGKKKNTREYFNDEQMLINSFIINNEELYKYSNMDKLNTNILLKSNYALSYKYFIDHHNYYKKNFIQTFLNDIISTTDDNNILKNNTYYSLNSTLYNFNSELSIEDKELLYKENLFNLLNTILPSTSSLIDKFKTISTNLNINDFLFYLQPNDTTINNIEVQNYTKIIAILNKNITEYKQTLVSNKEYFIRLLREKNKNLISKLKPNKYIFVSLFKKLNTQLISDFFNYYNIKNYEIEKQPITNSDKKQSIKSEQALISTSRNIFCDEEIYNMANIIDFNRTLFNSFYVNLFELITSNQIENFLDIKNKNINELQKEAIDTCKKYILSKKYLELDELDNDNNKIIYFDKKLDRTNYDLLEKLKENRKSMSQDDFKIYLRNKLLEDGLIENVDREVDTLLKGKREIIDGDYALLLNNSTKSEIGDNYSDKIYIRYHNKWVHDPNLNPKMFFISNKLFCNLQEKCIETNDTCNSFDTFETITENENIKDIINNTTAGFEATINETKDLIIKNLRDSIKFLERKIIYDNNNLLQYNDKELQISQTYIENVFIHSPYEILKNKILGYNDFVKKQDYIIKFCNLFTREPMNDEDKYWLYCNKTNQKLIPSFFKLLAQAYYYGNYLLILDGICADRGTISDDGNNWVDKYSGYIIKIIEFHEDAEYNEHGYKLQTKDVMEQEYSIQNPNIKYSSEISQIIFKIISSISNFIGLDLEQFHDFIINNVVAYIKATIPTKENYERTINKRKESGKTMFDDYQTFYNSTLIFTTMVFIVISIQTSVPSLKTKKTFPGCIKSFTGYPLNGNVDKSSIIYMACIVHNIKTNIAPWNSILKYSQNTLVKKMEIIIDTHVLKSPELLDIFEKKKEYLKFNKDDIIPDDLDLNRWTSFLPPLQEIKISEEMLQPISIEFKKNMLSNINKGVKNNYIYDLFYKINSYSFAIIKSIQNTVKEYSTLLNSNSGEPFLENACCNEFINTIDFFISKDPLIEQYNNNSKLLEQFLKDLKYLEQAPILYDPFNTKLKFYEISNQFNESIIYEYFIKKCRFDSILPIPEDVKAICLNKPADYNPLDTLERKIQILKDNGNIYSISSLDELMQIINFKNSFKLNNNDNIDSIQRLNNTLLSIKELMDSDESIKSLFNQKMIEKFIEVILENIDNIGKEIPPETDNANIRSFKNLLIQDTELNKLKVFEYIKIKANLNKKQFTNFTKCLNELFDFNTHNFQNIQQFIKNSMRNIIRVLPNIIINKLNTSDFICKHWKLSPKHADNLNTIAKDYYNTLYQFFDNKKIDLILNIFQDKCLLIEKIINYTNFYHPKKLSNLIIFTIFDEKLTKLLFENYFYKVLTYLVDIYTDPHVLIELGNIDLDLDYTKSQLSEEKNDFEIEGGVSKGEVDSETTKEIGYTSYVADTTVENDIANIIYTFVNIICSNKSFIDSESDFLKKVNYAKDKEKNTIVNFLKELSVDERQVEDILKNNKLERWSVGLQKGLTQYHPEFYDKELDKLEKQLIDERKFNKLDEVSKANMEIYGYEQEYQEQLQDEIDKEENDLSRLPDDNDNDYDDFEDPDYMNYDGDDFD